MTLHFSKIEELQPQRWMCKIAPNDYIKRRVRVKLGDILIDVGFRGKVSGIKLDEIIIDAIEGRPGEGRTYTVEGRR